VHDLAPSSDSDDDSYSRSNSRFDGGGDDGYLRYDVGLGWLQPWPRIYRLADDDGPSGDPWPVLPRHGGGATWHEPWCHSCAPTERGQVGACSFPLGRGPMVSTVQPVPRPVVN
jgi:hypothetical protein